MHLLCITGPPAVGKMTVGRAVCDLTGYRLFHNHLTIEPLLSVFGFGTPSFNRLNTLFRREVMIEAVAADLPGLVFTYAADFDNPDDLEHLRWLIAPVLDAGNRVDAVELYAAQEVRLAREGLPDRVAHKPSKRDVDLGAGARHRDRFASAIQHRAGSAGRRRWMAVAVDAPPGSRQRARRRCRDGRAHRRRAPPAAPVTPW